MSHEGLAQELREYARRGEKLLGGGSLCFRAAAAIEILDRICDGYETENQKLRNERVKAERERDAAVKQLHGYCPACKNYTENHCCGPCADCKYEYYAYRFADAKDRWEWIGLKDENNS